MVSNATNCTKTITGYALYFSQGTLYRGATCAQKIPPNQPLHTLPFNIRDTATHIKIDHGFRRPHLQLSSPYSTVNITTLTGTLNKVTDAMRHTEFLRVRAESSSLLTCVVSATTFVFRIVVRLQTIGQDTC